MTKPNPTKEQLLAAVKARACPRCGQAAGLPCKTPRGGWYNPRYNVHANRLKAKAEEQN